MISLSGELTAEEIVNLSLTQNSKDDVIYTYHPNYMKLGARVAIWGGEDNIRSIDVQFSACAYVGYVIVDELMSLFDKYESYIKHPENFGLAHEQ